MTKKFDWEHEGPSAQALEAFTKVTDEKEFPDSYSGQAWRAAYRLWKWTGGDVNKLPKSEWEYNPEWNWDELGLSGFMAGWATNAVRQMMHCKPLPNPAILTIGGPQEVYPSVGPAEIAMKDAMGAKD